MDLSNVLPNPENSALVLVGADRLRAIRREYFGKLKATRASSVA